MKEIINFKHVISLGMMTIPLSDGMRSYLFDEYTLDYDQEIFIEGLVVAKDHTKNKGINKGMQIIDDELHD